MTYSVTHRGRFLRAARALSALLLAVHACVILAHSVHDALHHEEVAELPRQEWCDLGKALHYLPLIAEFYVVSPPFIEESWTEETISPGPNLPWVAPFFIRGPPGA